MFVCASGSDPSLMSTPAKREKEEKPSLRPKWSLCGTHPPPRSVDVGERKEYVLWMS